MSCLQNDNQDAVFPKDARCGDVDGDPTTSDAFNMCAKYAADIMSPSGQLGGAIMYDSSKADISLHSVMSGLEAAKICCKEVRLCR